jgi:hypothetical protein
MLIICPVTFSTEVISSGFISGVPRFTAMTMSAPIARATSTGRLRTRPPSTSSRLPTRTGAMPPGTDIDARIAVIRLPSFSSTISPVPRSVAIARKGIGNSSKPRTVANFTSLRNCASTDTPVTIPFGSEMPSLVTPSSGMMYGDSSSALRRIGRSARGGRSVKRFAVVMVAMSRSISTTELPEA